MAKMGAAASWIAKQAHMVTYSDPIYDCWLKIIENLEQENKKPPITVFRFLCGLEESEVQIIQEEINHERIVLSKSAKDRDVVDMYDRIKQLKQDKLIQDALIEGFNVLNESSPCTDWKEVETMYSINDAIYTTILTMCEDWIKSKLKRGTKKMNFPENAVEYMRWAVRLQKAKNESRDFPWSIYVVSLQMEGNLYLKRHFNNEFPIGLCVLDLTKISGENLQWTEETFKNALDGILAVAGGSTTPGFVFLAFVDSNNFIKLQAAFHTMGDNLSYHCYGALHHFPLALCKGAIQFLTVAAFLGQGNAFEDLRRISEEHPIPIDCSLLQVANEGMSDLQYLEAKKRALVKHYIHTYCAGDCKLIDIFGDGSLVAQEGLHQKKEVLCLVGNVEEQKNLATRLLDFAKAHADIEEWAGLQIEQSTLQSDDSVSITKESRLQEGEQQQQQQQQQINPLSLGDFVDLETRTY